MGLKMGSCLLVEVSLNPTTTMRADLTRPETLWPSPVWQGSPRRRSWPPRIWRRFRRTGTGQLRVFGRRVRYYLFLLSSCATDNINSAAACWCRFSFKNQHAIVRHHSRVSLNNIYMDTYLMRNIYVILCDNCPAIVETVVCSADLIKLAYNMVQV